MDNFNRRESYREQNGSDRLTAPQARRLMKRVTRVILRNPAQTHADIARHAAVTPHDPKTCVPCWSRARDAATVPACPTCGAASDDKCVTGTGKPAKSPHKARTLPVAA